jgi:hypothetical protein
MQSPGPEDPRVTDRSDRDPPDLATVPPVTRDPDGGTEEPAPTIGARLKALWCAFVSGLG